MCPVKRAPFSTIHEKRCACVRVRVGGRGRRELPPSPVGQLTFIEHGKHLCALLQCTGEISVTDITPTVYPNTKNQPQAAQCGGSCLRPLPSGSAATGLPGRGVTVPRQASPGLPSTGARHGPAPGTGDCPSRVSKQRQPTRTEHRTGTLPERVAELNIGKANRN